MGVQIPPSRSARSWAGGVTPYEARRSAIPELVRTRGTDSVGAMLVIRSAMIRGGAVK